MNPRVELAGHAILSPSALLGTEHHYVRGLFGREQFAGLSTALQHVEGRFILSLYDVPQVREFFCWASVQTVELKY